MSTSTETRGQMEARLLAAAGVTAADLNGARFCGDQLAARVLREFRGMTEAELADALTAFAASRNA